jgi:DNA-binding NtrC family response regulator
MVSRTTTRIEAAAAPRAARLSVLFGPDRGASVEVGAVGATIGAQPACDLVLDDPAVSGRHATVRRAGGGFEVADLGSRNGTFFDGARIERAIVPAGATLRIGGSVVLLAPDEEYVALQPSTAARFGDLVGESVAMRRVYAVLERVSRSAATVLVTGESGTGKELCARAIHDASPRRDRPFVVFDGSAASETLLESDLFGHVRGAFTGADRDRQGAFAAAHGGTLFLDEIGELPLRLQPKLLRALESGEVQPLGGRKPSKLDVRVVAATNRDLADEVKRGAFRGDVYYRLAVVEVHLPALRERPEDLPALVRVLLAREGRDTGEALDPAVLSRLAAYAWPGNVRELRNVVARAVALAPPNVPFSRMPIIVGSTPASRPEIAASADRPFSEAKLDLVERFERAYLRDLLARHGDNLAQAARVADIERKHLYRLLEKHGLSRAPERD